MIAKKAFYYTTTKIVNCIPYSTDSGVWDSTQGSLVFTTYDEALNNLQRVLLEVYPEYTHKDVVNREHDSGLLFWQYIWSSDLKNCIFIQFYAQ